MTTPEECLSCGVLDALGRHDPMCDRAIKLGLPRLAEDEEPIDPHDQAEAELEREFEFTEIEPEPEVREGEGWSEQPKAMIRAVATENAIPEPADLWFSYAYVGDAIDDVVVFGSELDALRHAVAHGYKARRLKLGESLVDQVRDAQ